MFVSDLLGTLITFAPLIAAGLSLTGRWRPVMAALLRVLNELADNRKAGGKPDGSGNSNGSGNGGHHKQMIESMLMTQESESSRISRMEKAFDDFKTDMMERLNQQGLQTRGMFDSVLLNVSQMKQATNEKFISLNEHLKRQDGQLAELLKITRNGNGKHPPETSGDNP